MKVARAGDLRRGAGRGDACPDRHDDDSYRVGVAADKLDTDSPLSDLGLDSLMAIELRNWVEGDLRVELPAVELLKGPSITQLVDRLLEQLAQSDEAGTAKTAGGGDVVMASAAAAEDRDRQEAAELLSKVDEMSGEEVDAVLEKMEKEPTGSG